MKSDKIAPENGWKGDKNHTKIGWKSGKELKMGLFNLKEVELANKIKAASQAYYESGTSDYTDEEFDAMLKELKSINPNHPLLTKTGHGYDIENVRGQKVKHKYGRAGSLGKAYAINEIPESLRMQPMVQLSLKLDGLSIVLYYKDGLLDRALTRGNGDIGIDKTDRIMHIVPTALYNSRFTGAIRGELIFSKKGWQTFLSNHPNAKNPRNSAAGLINADEFDIDEFKLLDFVAYSVVGVEDVITLNKYWNFNHIDFMMNFLMDVRFPHIVPFISFVTEYLTPEALKEHMDRFRQLSTYEADGIVIKNHHVTLKDMGEGNEVIYDAIAFKFESETKETTVKDIEWNLSKTRYLVPTVVVEPIQLAGTTVQRATGYNAKYIFDNHIEKGAIVKITKCGEIIPNIVEVIKPAPVDCDVTICPVCGEKLVWDGVHLKCENEFCGNARMQDLVIWCKNIAPIDGFKDALIARFATMVYGEDVSIETVMDSTISNFATFRGSVQYDMFVNMINKLHSSEKVDIKSALLALNIPRLGDISSSKLANNPNLCKKIIDEATGDNFCLQNDTMDGIRKILGDATLDSILINFNKLKRLKYIKNRITYPEVKEVKGEVVVTGKLSVPRNNFEKELNAAGFILSGTVTKNTICLITDDPNGSSSKNKKASSLGIPKLSEYEFRSQYMS